MASREGGLSGRIGAIRGFGDPKPRRNRSGPVPQGPAAPGMPGFGEELAKKSALLQASVEGLPLKSALLRLSAGEEAARATSALPDRETTGTERWGAAVQRLIAEQETQRSGRARDYLATKGIQIEPETEITERSVASPSAPRIRQASRRWSPSSAPLTAFAGAPPIDRSAVETQLPYLLAEGDSSAPARRPSEPTSDARGIQWATEGAPLGSVFTASPGEDRAVRLAGQYVVPKRVVGDTEEIPSSAFGPIGDTEGTPPSTFDSSRGLAPAKLVDAIRRDALRGVFPAGSRVTRSDIGKAVAAGYTVQSYPTVAGASRDVASPEFRPDVYAYQRPDNVKGFLISLTPDGNDFLQVNENDLLEFAGNRERELQRRAPRQERYFEPTPSPVIQAVRGAGREDLLDEMRTPEDLRRYDSGSQAEWRKLKKTMEESYETKRGNLRSRSIPPGKGTDAKESRAATGDLLSLAARSNTGRYGQVRVNPLMPVETRLLNKDSSAAWERERQVTLAELVGELNNKYKTPVVKGRIGRSGLLEVASTDPDGNAIFSALGGFTPREYSGENDTQVGNLLRSIKIDESGIADPAFLGLDLPEVATVLEANKGLPPDRRHSMVQASVPVFEVRGRDGNPTGLFRVGSPAKRNTNFLLRELAEATKGITVSASDFPLPAKIARIQQIDYQNYNREDGKSGLKGISDLDIENARSKGYSFSQPEEGGLISYSDPSGQLAGYLVPRTVFAKGKKNTGVPIPRVSPRQPRFIMVPKDHEEWTTDFRVPLAGSAQGVALFSDQPGIRKFVEREQLLNPEEWGTLELLDAIASYQGAEDATAPITGGYEQFANPAVPGAFDVRLGETRQTPTSVQRLLDATQTLANRAHYVQDAIPGALRGVRSQPWVRRREPRGPSLGEIMATESQASTPTRDLDADVRRLEAYLREAVGDVLDPSRPPATPLQRFKQEFLAQQLEPLRAEIRRRDDAVKAVELAAGSGRYAPPATDPSQQLIPGLDPETLPRALSNPTPADYEAAMRRTIAARMGLKPRFSLDDTGAVVPFRDYASRVAERNEKVDELARQIGARMNPARDVGPSIDGRGFALVPTSPDRPDQERAGRWLIGQERPMRSVTPLQEVLARPARSIDDDASAPEMAIDPEGLGLGSRQPMWSDFAGVGEGGNPGFGVVRISDAVAQLLGGPVVEHPPLPMSRRPWSWRRYGSAPEAYRNPRSWSGGGFDDGPPDMPYYGPEDLY